MLLIMEKFILKTTSNKFMSEVYYMTLKDFKTLYPADAKKFDTKEEAEQFIKESGFDENFVYAIELSKCE